MSQFITPLAPEGSQFEPLDTGMTVNGNPWLAGRAVTSVVSPDGNTLLVVTSVYNRVFNAASNSLMTFDPSESNDYVLAHDHLRRRIALNAAWSTAESQRIPLTIPACGGTD
jgi:hypothetical protein